MRRSDEKGVVVLVLRGTGSNGFDGRHPERGDENDEHLEDSHAPKETGSRTLSVSPGRAISVSTATQASSGTDLSDVALAVAAASP
jgi:hypothetical protein